MNKRNFGLIGIFASILLFIGDMLLYGHFGNASEFSKNIQIVAQNSSQTRLFIGGILGPIGAMLYISGFWHIYLNTKQYSRFVSIIIFISLSCMMFFGGAYHSIWTIRMLLLKYPLASVDYSNLFLISFNNYFKTIFNISLSVGYLGGILLAILILIHKSVYPRWIVIVNPPILFFLTPLIKHVSYPFGSIIFGGYINIVLFVFLTTSVITTWKEKNIV
jgi:hypothetical protein